LEFELSAQNSLIDEKYTKIISKNKIDLQRQRDDFEIQLLEAEKEHEMKKSQLEEQVRYLTANIKILEESDIIKTKKITELLREHEYFKSFVALDMIPKNTFDMLQQDFRNKTAELCSLQAQMTERQSEVARSEYHLRQTISTLQEKNDTLNDLNELKNEKIRALSEEKEALREYISSNTVSKDKYEDLKLNFDELSEKCGKMKHELYVLQKLEAQAVRAEEEKNKALELTISAETRAIQLESQLLRAENELQITRAKMGLANSSLQATHQRLTQWI
jgi:septal ring factor EnvC (AmiA/AmiB activator)